MNQYMLLLHESSSDTPVSPAEMKESSPAGCLGGALGRGAALGARS
jgi:hypothetical protein